MTNDSLIYEAPLELVTVDLELEATFQQATDDLVAKNHKLEIATRGNDVGHMCAKCKIFKKEAKFNNWLTGLPCNPKATACDRKAAFEQDFTRTVKAARFAKKN